MGRTESRQEAGGGGNCQDGSSRRNSVTWYCVRDYTSSTWRIIYLGVCEGLCAKFLVPGTVYAVSENSAEDAVWKCEPLCREASEKYGHEFRGPNARKSPSDSYMQLLNLGAYFLPRDDDRELDDRSRDGIETD